jgi:ribosomal protein L11 methyltransferase
VEKPIRRIVVVPPWQERDEGEGEVVLRIQLGQGPRLAFGFGTHETTSMVLSLLTGLYAERAPRPARVLDVGCGSGILSIAAARLGASEVLGVDIAREALQIAPENAAVNCVEGVCRFQETPVAEVPGTYGLVLGNLLGPILRELRGAICDRARGGLLIISGYKTAERDELLPSYESRGLRLRTDVERGGWCAALLTSTA